MAVVSVDGRSLEVRLTGMRKIWTFRRRISVPLSNVRGVTADPGIVRDSKGWRAPGTHIPGVSVAGTFHQDGDRIFWDVKRPEKAIVIELTGEPFQRLVLEVEDPDRTISEIEGAIRRHA